MGDNSISYLKQSVEQATAKHNTLLEQIQVLTRKNKELEQEAAELNKSLVSSNNESNNLKRTISEANMNSESVYNRSKSASSEIETLTVTCDALRTDIEKSRKSAEGFKFAAKDRAGQISGNLYILYVIIGRLLIFNQT